MNIFQTISMSFKSIFSNKVRSFLTMLGVIIGVSSVIVLVSLVDGVNAIQMKQWYTSNLIQVSYYGQDPSFPEKFEEYCSTELSEYVDILSPVSLNYGESTHFLDKVATDGTFVYSDSSYVGMKDIVIEQGRNIAPGDVKSRTKVALIGSFLNDQFFGGLSDPIGQKINVAGVDYTVIGVLKNRFGQTEHAQYTEDNIVIVPHSTMIFNENARQAFISEYTIIAKDAESTQKAVDTINETFRNFFTDGENINAYTDNEWVEQMKDQTRMMSLIVGAIGSISLLVGGIGIMNIMLVSVTERTREIGIRMAIGAKRKNITGQFLIEAAAVSGFGGIVGILFGSLCTIVAGSFITKQIIYPAPDIVIGSFLFSVLLGVVFGIYPANKASKLNPIDALRTQ